MKITVWLVYEDRQWSALAAEFDIVGLGSSHEAALENLFENLGTYLASYAQDGAPFNDALRPIPFRETLRFRVGALLTTAERHLPTRSKSQQHPRSVQRTHEDLTPQGFAHC